MNKITFDSAKQIGIVFDNTRKFLNQVDLKRKGDWGYYNKCKQTLSRICGYDSPCFGPQVLFNQSVNTLIKLLEI